MSSRHKIEIKDIENNIYFQNSNELFLQLVELAERGHCGQSLNSKCSLKKYKDYPELRNWILSILPNCINSSKYTWTTKIYWILHNLTEFPHCHNEKCNKPMKMNIKSLYFGYWPYCSNQCQITSRQFKEQRQKTWRENLGVEYPTQSKKVIEKRKKNNLEKYNATSPSATEKVKRKCKQTRYLKNNGKYESEETKCKRQQTNIERYGNRCILHSEYGRKKTIETWSEKYGVDHPLKSIVIRGKGKETCKRLYGEEFFQSSSEFKSLWMNEDWKSALLEKQFETKRKNNTFNTSKDEEKAFVLLKQKYPEVLRQYSSLVYPFNCDFYIPSEDLYIECNFSWVHQFHLFNQQDSNDIQRLNFLLEKSKSSKYYKNVVCTWTMRDVIKHQTFIENKLNYLIFWNINEVKKFVETK